MKQTGVWRRTSFLLLPALAIWCWAGTGHAAEVPAAVPAAAVREDLAYLYSYLQEAHYDLFAHRSKVEYDAAYQLAMESIDQPMTQADLARLFQRFMAYGKVGHSRMEAHITAFLDYRSSGGVFFPLFLRVEGGRAYLLEAASLRGDLPAGTEILTVAKQPVLAWLDQLSAYVSAERPYMAYAQLEKALPIAVWLAQGASRVLDVTARHLDGPTFATRVEALSAPQRKELTQRFPTPTLRTDFSQREVRILAPGIAYLRPGPFYNSEVTSGGPEPSYETSAFCQFLEKAFQRILASRAGRLIIDLRNNPGGDNSFSDPMVAWFAREPFRFASSFRLKASAATKAQYATQESGGDPVLAQLMAAEARQPNGARYAFDLPLVQPRKGKRYRGKIYVLVNRHSYSNATTTAALIQDYRFGTILGEETADLPTSFASVLHFGLPRTGLTVTYPKSHFIRPNGDTALKGVIPDHRLANPVKPSSEDQVLNEAVLWIKTLH